MGIAKRNVRGLQDILTYSGRVDRTFQPHKAHLKLAVLEMEKVRRGKERESAVHRIRNIDARFGEIEAEKGALLQSLAKRESGNSPDAASNQPTPALRRSARGAFKLKY